MFYTFWLGNGLRATTACNFSSLIWPAGSAPAALASLLFEPPEPQIIGKAQSFATLRLHLLSSDPFSSLTLPAPAFPSVHIVGSLTSKFPSGLYMYIHNLYIYICIYICIYIYMEGSYNMESSGDCPLKRACYVSRGKFLRTWSESIPCTFNQWNYESRGWTNWLLSI